MKKQTKKLIPVIVTTEHRGVWYAEIDPNEDTSTQTLRNLKNCRMVIYFGTTNGLQELCATGPTAKSKLGSVGDIRVLYKVTAIMDVSPAAAEVWRLRGI